MQGSRKPLVQSTAATGCFSVYASMAVSRQLGNGQSFSPEAEVVDGGGAGQEDIKSGYIASFEGCGGGLDDHSAP